MMSWKCFIVFCWSGVLLFLGSFNAQAQLLKKDTIDRKARYQVIQLTYDIEHPTYELRDTALVNFQRYRPTEERLFEYAHLGNLGQAHQPLVFEYNRSVGFDIGFHNYDLYFFDKHQVPYFKTLAPLTEIGYLLGSQEEQKINFTHAQQFIRGINSCIDYQRVTSKGIYENSKGGVHAFAFTNWYQSKNKKYNVYASMVWNKATPKLNGGMTSAFNESQSSILRRIANVNLPDAESSFRDMSYFIRQSWDLGRNREIAINDSVSKTVFEANWRLAHSIRRSVAYHQYTDNQQKGIDNFYPITNYNSSGALDTTSYTHYENIASLQYLRFKDIPLLNNGWMIGRLHHHYLSQTDSLFNFISNSDTTYTDTTGQKYNYQSFQVSGDLQNEDSFENKLHYHVHAAYGLTGYLQNNFELNTKLRFTPNPAIGYFQAYVSLQNLSPTLMQTHWKSSHIEWDNDFQNTTSLQWQLKYFFPKLNLELAYNSYALGKHIVYGENAIPIQLDETVLIQQLKASFGYRLGKFHFQHAAAVQYKNSDYIRIPAFYTRHNVYFQDNIFSDAMRLQAGIDISYTTDYDPYQFMPSNSQFYAGGDEVLNFLPIADLYVNMKIGQVRIFTKAEYINQGIGQSVYYHIADYPMPDTALKVGFNWQFYD